MVDRGRCGSSFASTSIFSVDKERRSSAESKDGGKEQKEREALIAAECFNTLGSTCVKFRKTIHLNL